MIISGIDYFSITSKVIVEEAKKMGFEVEILSENKNFYVIKGNGKEIYFKNNDCFLNSSLGFKIADDKTLTNIVLERNGVRVPKSIYLNKKNIENFSINNSGLKYPLVTKPINLGSGKGVCTKLENEQELKDGMLESFKYSDEIIIQEFIEGDEHRVVVIGDKIVLCIKRVPAHIIGNGKNTIKELIEIENENPLRGEGYSFPLSYIKINDNLINYISKKGLNLETIPKDGEYIQLLGISNIGKGGIPVVMTDKMGDKLKQECINIAKLVGLKVVGLDVITTDLSKSLKESNGAIIEINDTPGFGGHENNITAKELLKYVFELD